MLLMTLAYQIYILLETVVFGVFSSDQHKAKKKKNVHTEPKKERSAVGDDVSETL